MREPPKQYADSPAGNRELLFVLSFLGIFILFIIFSFTENYSVSFNDIRKVIADNSLLLGIFISTMLYSYSRKRNPLILTKTLLYFATDFNFKEVSIIRLPRLIYFCGSVCFFQFNITNLMIYDLSLFFRNLLLSCGGMVALKLLLDSFTIIFRYLGRNSSR